MPAIHGQWNSSVEKENRLAGRRMALLLGTPCFPPIQTTHDPRTAVQQPTVIVIAVASSRTARLDLSIFNVPFSYSTATLALNSSLDTELGLGQTQSSPALRNLSTSHAVLSSSYRRPQSASPTIVLWPPFSRFPFHHASAPSGLYICIIIACLRPRLFGSLGFSSSLFCYGAPRASCKSWRSEAPVITEVGVEVTQLSSKPAELGRYPLAYLSHPSSAFDLGRLLEALLESLQSSTEASLYVLLSTSAIRIESPTGHENAAPRPRLHPRYYRRSVGVLPITQSTPSKALILSPTWKHPHAQTSLIPAPATLPNDSNISLSSPLTLRQPITSAIRTSGTARSTQSTTHPQTGQATIEDLTPRGPQMFESSFHTEVPSDKKTDAANSSPRLYYLLTPSAYRSKNRLSPKMKSSFFSALNKSDPNLSTDSTPQAKRSPISNKYPHNSVTNLEKSNQTKSPLMTELSPSLATQAPSPTLSNGDNPPLTTSPSLQHQKMRSIFNSTSKRISIFTSRLNHSSAASWIGPNTHRDAATAANIGTSTPQLNNSVEQSLLSVILPDSISRSPPMDSESSSNKNANASNNSRIHSPGFYQSLKMRWKPEHSVRSVLALSPSSSTPPTKENKAQTFSNYEKLKRSQKLAISSFDELLPPQIPLPQRSSRISLAEFLTSRNLKRSDTCEKMETIELTKTDCKPVCTFGSKKMTPRPAQTHSPRPRAASTSSTISNSARDPLSSFALQFTDSHRRFSHLKPLQLQVEHPRRRPVSTAFQVKPSKVNEELKFQNGLHPEINLAISALATSSSLDSITDILPEILTGRSSVMQQSDTKGTELQHCSLPSASSLISERTPGYVPLNGIRKRDSTVSTLGPSVQRKLCSEKYDNDLMTFLLPSPQMGSDKSKDPLNLLDGRLAIISSTKESDCLIGTTDHHLEVPTRRRPSLEKGGGRKKNQVGTDTKQPADLVTECNNSLLAENLHHTKYKSTDSRRSSISSVLNRKDSLDSSTPDLFQGIWEKELEENERKWKRLARLSCSRMTSEDLKSYDTAGKDLRAKLPNTAGSKRLSPSAVKSNAHKPLNHIEAPFKSITRDTINESDCLSKIWDSFKSEADISLSEMSYDATLNDDLGGKLDHIDHHYIPEETELLNVEPIKQKTLLKASVPNPYNHSSSLKAPVVGLGLVDLKSNSCGRFDVTSFTRSYHDPALAKDVTSKSSVDMHKLRKPSLPSGKTFEPPPSSSTSTNLEGNCVKRTAGISADDSFAQNSILDLSLVNAFPTPPKGHRTSLSSSSSNSSKSILSPRKNRTRVSLIARCESNALMFTDSSLRMGKTSRPNSENKTANPSMMDIKPIKFPDNQSMKTSSKPSNNLPEGTVHQPTSFSNRPRAQSGYGRAPPPAPIQIFSSSQPTSVSSDKTVSSGKTRRRSLAVTGGKNATSQLMRSPIYKKPPAPPPNVPLPLEPGHNLHSPSHNHESKYLNKTNCGSPSSQSKLSPGALNPGSLSPGSLSPGSLSPGGLTVKRPSLVIRPKLTSSRSGGIYPTPGPSRPLLQASITTSPTTFFMASTTITQDTPSSEFESPMASRSFIVDLHHDLVDQSKDAAQSSSSNATCSSLFSSIGNSSISTSSTISSPCTPSSTRHNHNHHIPPLPLPLTHSSNSPNLTSHRLGRVLLSPPSLVPFSFTEPSQLLTTPRTAIAKLDPSKPSTPNTIKPTNKSISSPSPSAEQRFRSKNRRFPRLKNDLLSPTGPSAISSPKPLDKSEWVSYGMAM
ncbi:hypothetical protein DFH28DRAFT_1110203 [Melampsora americana]|nr:hypothetical protein DFH28DRAFT_1110203 [Melampsora americana]